MFKKTIMIIGTGVLGSYLSKHFLNNGHNVYVTTRYKKVIYKNYNYNKIEKKVKFIKLNVLNKNEILRKIKQINPNFIYYFAGQSSIFISYKKKLETVNSNYYGALNFLKILKKEKLKTKFYKASSGYIFDIFKYKKKKEIKYIKPNNPYVKSQIEAFKSVIKYRKMGVSCSSLIFFNIESPLKSSSFLLNKIRNFIKFKKTKFLKLGDINAYRDFSWAPEIMMGVYYASKLTTQDIIFSSGKTFLIKDMVKYFFHINKLSYENFVIIDKKLYRKNEKKKLVSSVSNATQLLKKWRWNPKIYGKKLILKLNNSPIPKY